MDDVILKTRPLEPGHELRVEGPKKVTKDGSSRVSCSCGRTIAYGSRRRFQEALDAAARSHRSELVFGDFRLSRLLETLELELEGLDVDEILERYGTPVAPVEWKRSEFDHRIWIRTRRTPSS